MEKPFSHSLTIRGKHFIDAGKVSTEIKSMLKELGVQAEIIRRVAIATYEAEMNVVMYAEEATVTVELTSREIKIVIDDRGPGIADIELAMQEGFSTATPEMREMGFGAGMGLPNIRKNADDLKIGSRMGEGTKVEITVGIN
jgi:anti-sigma regulatory factor (Ser/Thr protein kinase)